MAEQPTISREEGARLFGQDPAGYGTARPPYPEGVYELLVSRCGLRQGCRVLDIGAGAGAVEPRLARLGVAEVVAVEPDARLAGYLAGEAARQGWPVRVVTERFEDAALEGPFDMVVSATAFHWVDPEPGLRKVAGLLRPGGWLALWWNVFGDVEPVTHFALPDAFVSATDPVLAPLASGPSQGAEGVPYPFEVEKRKAEIEATGAFDMVEHTQFRWDWTMDPAQVRALYSTFSNITRLPPVEQGRVLDELERIASEQFGGVVTRRFSTSIYTARRR